MNACLVVVTGLLCFVSFLAFGRDIKRNIPSDNDKSEANVFSKSMLIYSGIMIVVTISAAVLFCTLYKDTDLFVSIKRLSLLCLLWPIAYIDYKSYRIPNIFIILGLSYRVFIFPFELVYADYNVWAMLLSEVIAAAALFLASMICSLCIKNSIGYGDIKMFVVMGLLLSLDAIWSAIFLSLIVSFIVSMYLLATKKKSRKDAIPFGPAIVIGTYLSVCLSGM